MTAHRHAALMAEYAKDAAETERPWERWEWKSNESPQWYCCPHEFYFHTHREYRRKNQPLCQVEGKDVFVGDHLWHIHENRWRGVARGSLSGPYMKGHGIAFIDKLTWTEPKKKKTLYQWAYKGSDGGWDMSLILAESEEEWRKITKFQKPGVIRLDHTKIEVEE